MHPDLLRLAVVFTVVGIMFLLPLLALNLSVDL